MVVHATTIAFVFLYGLLFGSFVNVVGYRVPRGESLVRPRSHCPHCGHTLSGWELIPALSWLLLCGKCRMCKAGISVRYPATEISVAALFVATIFIVPSWPGRAVWFLFWMLLLAVVVTDLTSMRVPNILSLPGALGMVLLAPLAGVQSWWMSLGGAAVCFLVMFSLNVFSGGKMGMGDVKLYLSIGAMLGPTHGLESLVVASFAGTIVGGCMRWMGLLGRKQYMPFVPYITVGVIVIVFFGRAMETWYLHHVIGWAA